MAALQRPASRDDAGFLCVEGVSKRFGELPAVRDVSLQVAHAEIFALLGSSGCGKSTLLRMVVSVPCVHWGEAPPPARGDPVWLSWSGPEGVVLER